MLEEIIKQVTLNQGPDSVHWNLNRGNYRTVDGYKVLIQEDSNIQDQWTWIWHSKNPPKIKIFLWKISHHIAFQTVFAK